MEINTVKNGLYIDYRESLLITNLKDKVEFKTENMIIGDIIFYKENDIMLLIERKTIFDLAFSKALKSMQRVFPISLLPTNQSNQILLTMPTVT